MDVCMCVWRGREGGGRRRVEWHLKRTGRWHCATAAVSSFRLFNCTWSRKSSSPAHVVATTPSPIHPTPASGCTHCCRCGALIIHCKYGQLIILFRVCHQVRAGPRAGAGAGVGFGIARWLKYLARWFRFARQRYLGNSQRKRQWLVQGQGRGQR